MTIDNNMSKSKLMNLTFHGQRCAGLGQFYQYSFCAGQEIGFTKASKSHMENGWLFQLACYMLGTAQSCSRDTFERNLLTGLDLTITGIYIKTVQKQEKKKMNTE